MLEVSFVIAPSSFDFDKLMLGRACLTEEFALVCWLFLHG